jgi:hypothetical protein
MQGRGTGAAKADGGFIGEGSPPTPIWSVRLRVCGRNGGPGNLNQVTGSEYCKGRHCQEAALERDREASGLLAMVWVMQRFSEMTQETS